MKQFDPKVAIYYIITFLGRLYFYLPILVIRFNNIGLSITQIMVLFAIYSISQIIFEVPTGVFADKVGYKWSLGIGFILEGIAITLLGIMRGYIILCILEMLFGMGETFCSGASDALLYDHLKVNARENEFKSIIGKVKMIVFTAMSLSAVLSGYTAKINFSFPFLASGISFSAAGLITFFSFEEPDIHNASTKYFDQVKDSLLMVSKKKELLWYFIYYVIIIDLVIIAMWFFQPFLKHLGVNIAYFGWFYVTLNIMSFLGSLLSHKISTNKSTVLLLSCFLGSIFIGIYLLPNMFGIILSISVFLIYGIFLPIGSTALNNLIPSEKRATTLSLQSFFSSIFYSIAIILLGVLSDLISVMVVFLTLGLITISLISIMSTWDILSKRRLINSRVL